MRAFVRKRANIMARLVIFRARCLWAIRILSCIINDNQGVKAANTWISQTPSLWCTRDMIMAILKASFQFHSDDIAQNLGRWHLIAGTSVIYRLFLLMCRTSENTDSSGSIFARPTMSRSWTESYDTCIISCRIARINKFILFREITVEHRTQDICSTQVVRGKPHICISCWILKNVDVFSRCDMVLLLLITMVNWDRGVTETEVLQFHKIFWSIARKLPRLIL